MTVSQAITQLQAEYDRPQQWIRAVYVDKFDGRTDESGGWTIAACENVCAKPHASPGTIRLRQSIA